MFVDFVDGNWHLQQNLLGRVITARLAHVSIQFQYMETRWNTVNFISVEVSPWGPLGVFPWFFLSRSEHRFDLLRCPHRLSAANLLCLKNLPPDHVPCESEHVPACFLCAVEHNHDLLACEAAAFPLISRHNNDFSDIRWMCLKIG